MKTISSNKNLHLARLGNTVSNVIYSISCCFQEDAKLLQPTEWGKLWIQGSVRSHHQWRTSTVNSQMQSATSERPQSWHALLTWQYLCTQHNISCIESLPPPERFYIYKISRLQQATLGIALCFSKKMRTRSLLFHFYKHRGSLSAKATNLPLPSCTLIIFPPLDKRMNVKLPIAPPKDSLNKMVHR